MQGSSWLDRSSFPPVSLLHLPDQGFECCSAVVTAPFEQFACILTATAKVGYSGTVKD